MAKCTVRTCETFHIRDKQTDEAHIVKWTDRHIPVVDEPTRQLFSSVP